MKKYINPLYSEKAFTYNQYMALITDLLAENKTTGQYQSPELTAYARLNLARMNRINKTVVISDSLKAAILAIADLQTWYVLTEGWCGDAAQILPVLHEIAALNDKITLRILLRDENLELMDLYLQNGKSRSIPKLIVVDASSDVEVLNWGPRPAELQKIYDLLKQENKELAEIAEQLHTWYAQNKTVAIQTELTDLLLKSAQN